MSDNVLNLRDVKILLVDDDPDSVKIIIHFLKKMGITKILRADSGISAIDQLNKSNTDLIISDCFMPGMTGLDLFKFIRANDKLKNIPFLLMTANTQKGHTLQAREAGITHQIAKPIDFDTLKIKLNEMSR